MSTNTKKIKEHKTSQNKWWSDQISLLDQIKGWKIILLFKHLIKVSVYHPAAAGETLIFSCNHLFDFQNENYTGFYFEQPKTVEAEDVCSLSPHQCVPMNHLDGELLLV